MSASGRVQLRSRFDLTVDVAQRVGWEKAAVALERGAADRMDESARAFDALVRSRVAADPQALIYGVTSAPGDRAGVALDEDEQARRPSRLWTGMSFGEALPGRVTRMIALARLANFLDGHAAVRSPVAVAVVEMLNADAIPEVPSESNGGSGEILALGLLFGDLSERIELTAKERMALINGSPCAAALMADTVLTGRRRLRVAGQVFALVAQAAGAPSEHYLADLEPLWGDEHEAAALRSLRALLDGPPRSEQSHQASVSLRILPRVLASALRAQDALQRAAETALSSVSDNPVFLPPDRTRPEGAIVSTGGYHNAQAAPALDALTFAHADLCQLAQRLGDHMFHNPATAALVGGTEWAVKPLHMAINGWAEEARASAAPTLLSLGAFGQNDVPELAFLAWRKATQVSRCLDGALTGLVVLASQALYGQQRCATAATGELLDDVREIVAPVGDPRPLGPECQALFERFTEHATGVT